MPSYVATLRLVYSAADDIEASAIAEICREHAEEELDIDEDEDEAIITQIESMGSSLIPEELLARLVRTRNDLIRTKYVECWNLARELDRMTHALRQKLAPDDQYAVVNYDHGHFLEVTTAILTKGESPNE